MLPLLLLLVSPQAGIAADATTPPAGFHALSPSELEQDKDVSAQKPRAFQGLSPEAVETRATELKFNLGAPVQPATDVNSTLQFETWNGRPANFGPGPAVSATIGHGVGFVIIRFQGSPGATYLLDCAVQDNIPYSVKSSFANGYGAMEGRQIAAGGHLLIPFARAPSDASATAKIMASDFTLYGCQVDAVR
jgi:hypothetical protein